MGAGSWGTTFAQVLCDAGTPAVLFARSPDLWKVLTPTRQNPAYLPGIALTDALRATADPAEALDGADLVVLAVPAQSLRENLARWAPLLPPGALLVSLMKGIELGTCNRMSEVISQVASAPAERIAVVSGPTLSREIARREHAATVVACTDNAAAERLQRACHTGYFRPYTNPDVTGCELGGAVKNVIALGVGMAVGMGLGDNTRAMLITRGPGETARAGAALCAGAADPARPGRDGPPGRGARGRSAHVRRARRHGRPGRDLQFATVPQPYVRREPRPGNGCRGRDRHYKADGRGGEVVAVRAGTGQTARRGDADHGGEGGGHAPWPGSQQGRGPADQPFGEARALRHLKEQCG